MMANTESSYGWRQVVMPPTASIKDAINNLNSTTMQVVLVVDAEGVLVGTLTDGDIRRSLLLDARLDRPIVGMLQTDPIVVGSDVGREAALAILRSKRLRHLPIVDDGHLVGLHNLEEFSEPVARPNLMVVMAGGEGRRLRPYTESCPKPMLPVEGRPILEHILERAAAQGFRRLVFAVHYLAHMIVDHFGDGGTWGVDIEYIHEEQLLGTAGALALLEPVAESPIVVTNGDVLTTVDYTDMLEFHDLHNARATMAVSLHEWQHPFGVVQTSGVDIVGFEEKPRLQSYVNAGVYVLEPDVISLLEGQPCDMPVLFDRIHDSGGRTIVFPVHEPWIDVGHEADYLRVRHDLGRLDEVADR
jgi:dTDP-glucose pyrophosphorylase